MSFTFKISTIKVTRSKNTLLYRGQSFVFSSLSIRRSYFKILNLEFKNIYFSPLLFDDFVTRWEVLRFMIHIPFSLLHCTRSPAPVALGNRKGRVSLLETYFFVAKNFLSTENMRMIGWVLYFMGTHFGDRIDTHKCYSTLPSIEPTNSYRTYPILTDIRIYVTRQKNPNFLFDYVCIVGLWLQNCLRECKRRTILRFY